MTFWIGYFPIQKHRPEARRQQGRPRRNHNTPHSLRRSDSTARGLTPREQPEPTTSLTRPGSRASPCVGGQPTEEQLYSGAEAGRCHAWEPRPPHSGFTYPQRGGQSPIHRYPEPGLPHGGFADTLRTRTAGEHIQHRFLLHGQLDHGRAHLRAKMRRGATDVPDTGSLTIAPVAIRGYPRRHIIRK